ncbi:MAG: tetrahydrofolate dehydrogenase/cyclohydrolase catalytic domain-containing protein, partial [Dehalococcoidia bacterium]
MTIIDGAAIARDVTEDLRPRVAALHERGVTPGLVAVLVGDNPASLSYVGGKSRASAKIGIEGRTLRLPATISQEDLQAEVERLNADPAVHGIIVQMPLPEGLDGDAATSAVLPAKDVDGLHPKNLGLLLRGEGLLLPATPAGVQELLLRSGTDPAGKHV